MNDTLVQRVTMSTTTTSRRCTLASSNEDDSEVEDGDDDEGEFYTSFRVPEVMDDGDDEEDVTGGTYYVFVTYGGEDDIVAVDEFTIIGITIDPEKGTVGTKVKITGAGFGKRDDIDIEYDDKDIDIESGSDETDSKGKFTSYIIVPKSTEGDHTIGIKVNSDEAEAEFTVQPQVTIDPTSGSPGAKVTVTGTGFAKDEDITITFDDDEVDISGDDATDKYGSFEATFNVPVVKPGKYDVGIEDDDGNKDEAKFTIAASINLSPTTGDVGTEMTVSGTGFIAGGTVTINYDAAEVATAPTASDGAFSATFNAPASKGGAHTITAADGTVTMTATFTMESTAPPIPAPLLPLDGDKAKSQAFFDWKDVDDFSLPVTYTFQIATDDEFTEDSIVLKKEGLTDSEYTIAKEEKLESTKKEAPYSWRVKAIDGASNESEWSGAGSFYVGFVFEMSSWVFYVLGVLGALLFIFLGFLLGRRTAYY